MVPARATTTDLANLGAGAARIANITSGVQQAQLDAASDLVDGFLSRQYPLPLSTPYPRDVIQAECYLAAAGIFDLEGWNPSSPAEKRVVERAQWYLDTWLPGVAKGEVGPNISNAPPEDDGPSSPSGPEVITSTTRGYSERGCSNTSMPCPQSGAFSDD